LHGRRGFWSKVGYPESSKEALWPLVLPQIFALCFGMATLLV
jgi:hypothetical protein